MSLPLYVTIPLCLAVALAIVGFVYGVFAVIDQFNLNRRKPDE